MALGDGHIYVADSSADRFFDVTVDAWTVAAVAQGVRSGSIGYDPATKAVYLFPIGGITAWIWDTTTASLLPALRLSDRGLGFTSYSWQGESRALIPTAVGGTDVLNTGTRSRIDTVITDRQPQSEALGKEFFDMGEASAPSLISIVTRDGLTLAERWQVIYEGVIAGSEGLSVQINGDLLTAPGALFQSGLALESTDRVTIGPYGAREEVAVAEVLSETELKLAAAPTQQGAQTVAIRPDSRYLVVGTRSGFQKGRLREGEAYTSDGSEISLTIRGSRTKPTTRGDFFTFLTTEGIEPISPNRRGVARKVTVFSPPDGSGLSAYVIQEGTGTLSVLNLRTLQERRTIP
jgi:hypothetical protein